jgi:SSS family solute:Na+ symporter
MVFLGIVMMPFYYGSKVRSVPEYLRRRFDNRSHLFNAATFAVASVLIAGVNLYALALVVHLLLGWPIWLAILLSATFVLIYITLGGLTSAIYNEVLQFFLILAGLIPLVVVGLHANGGWSGLKEKVAAHENGGDGFLSSWGGTAVGDVTNPIAANWIAIVLGLGFVLSFGYWTTNFAEVQRALSAKDMSAARRTPIIAAYPKIFIPVLTVIPGLIALVEFPKLGAESGDFQYNNAIPLLMEKYLPNGVLGIAVTALIAAFMAGMAANVSSFNTVFTYDIWQDYIRKDREDAYYLRFGRIVTVVGVVIGVGTAFIAAGYSNIMNYIQALFSIFNAPLFATFIIGMFWRRMTPAAGIWGLVAGTAGAAFIFVTSESGVDSFGFDEPLLFTFGSGLSASFWGAVVAFVADAVVSVVVSLFTQPKPAEDLEGLVYGSAVDHGDIAEGDKVWWRNPVPLGLGAVALAFLLYIPFA